MKYCTNCVSPSSAPLPGKTSSNGCYYALRQNKNIISASNSSPSHSLTLESFAQVKTCNQFIMKKNIAAVLVINALVFSGKIAFAADEQQSQHITEALKHVQEALDYAKQGHNDVLIEHAE